MKKGTRCVCKINKTKPKTSFSLGHREGGPTGFSKKSKKRHFFRDIEKSFQEVTPIGPEPHQFFSF